MDHNNARYRPQQSEEQGPKEGGKSTELSHNRELGFPRPSRLAACCQLPFTGDTLLGLEYSRAGVLAPAKLHVPCDTLNATWGNNP